MGTLVHQAIVLQLRMEGAIDLKSSPRAEEVGVGGFYFGWIFLVFIVTSFEPHHSSLKKRQYKVKAVGS